MSPARPSTSAPGSPTSTIGVALALALGTAVALGLARFSYALFLPPMRADLGWSYLVSGAMNTANAAGYLAGALAAPACLRAFGARRALVASMALTTLLLVAHGLVAGDASLYALRALSGTTSAVIFVCGGFLASHLASGGHEGTARRTIAGLVLGIYYGGTGVGIVASAALVPTLATREVAHAWQGGWLALGALGLVATLVTAWATRHLPPDHGARVPGSPRRAYSHRPFAAGLSAYLFFGLGYIGYMTFIVTLLREEQLSNAQVMAFFAMLGAAVVASSWLWAPVLQRFRGGETLSLLSALLVVATLLPVATTNPVAVFASGLLFGGVFLQLVASTTALVRHNVEPPDWPAAITSFTVVFAAGQIVGPSLVGYIADKAGGLRGGLACSAAMLAVCAAVAWRQKPLRPSPSSRR